MHYSKGIYKQKEKWKKLYIHRYLTNPAPSIYWLYFMGTKRTSTNDSTSRLLMYNTFKKMLLRNMVQKQFMNNVKHG